MAWIDVEPTASDRLHELTEALYHQDVDAAVLDVMRRRIDSLIAGRPMVVAATLTDEQQVALMFAEQYVLDVRGFTDADNDRLHAHFTDGQLTTLTFAVAVFDASARTNAILGR
jgi:alkylhydroperoxidase family enzyme